jgi:hypothetical protein
MIAFLATCAGLTIGLSLIGRFVDVGSGGRFDLMNIVFAMFLFSIPMVSLIAVYRLPGTVDFSAITLLYGYVTSIGTFCLVNASLDRFRRRAGG